MSSSYYHPEFRGYLSATIFLSLLMSLPVKTQSLHFNFSSFNTSNPGLSLQGKASISPESLLELTINQMDKSAFGTMGRALYPTPVQLWDATTNRLTDFSTEFTFSIEKANTSYYGDGLAFLLLPVNTPQLNNAGGGSLGIYGYNSTDFQFLDNETIVAVEFDTYQNPQWDPSSLDHIGIDVNSVKSVAYTNVSIGLRNQIAQAFISYDSTTKNLAASVSINGSTFNVSYTIDLRSALPERVQVGFSASTGLSAELHQIHSWSFNSTLEDTVVVVVAPAAATNKNKRRMVIAVAAGISILVVLGVAIVWIRLRRRKSRYTKEENVEVARFDFDEDFDNEAGPKSFSYSKLSQATSNFSMEGKLGEGGFGGVYKGVLTGLGGREIAVKKIKSGSSQGKKEYMAEVKIISRLRHRNLVQLLGWCHENEQLLLVYEFMPNRSLDSHLFSYKSDVLPWTTRYRITLGLSSALIYLHEEWEQSVVHRDIKSSNVMLDLNFNPKLGDFGLARLADHDAGLQTTALAGTPGYMAPECLLSGKASKESDVYSFGIVALEIACGRKVIEVKEQASKVNLVQWVWDLYGKGLILEAVDKRLEGDFEEQQAKCMVVVGLWCSHPDVSYRPSIKQAIAALNYETPLPSLPTQLPVPIYVSPSMNMSVFSTYASSNMADGYYEHTSGSSINTSTTSSSQPSEKSTSSTYPL